MPLYLPLDSAMVFTHQSIQAVIDPKNLAQGVLERADILTLYMIRDNWGKRPMYFSRTSGNYGLSLGLGQYLLTQGLARKLLPTPPGVSTDTVAVQGEGFVDVKRSLALWNTVFEGQQSIISRGDWVDKPSAGIPALYVSAGIVLADDCARAARRRRPKVSRPPRRSRRPAARSTGSVARRASSAPARRPVRVDIFADGHSRWARRPIHRQRQNRSRHHGTARDRDPWRRALTMPIDRRWSTCITTIRGGELPRVRPRARRITGPPWRGPAARAARRTGAPPRSRRRCARVVWTACTPRISGCRTSSASRTSTTSSN
ncbi:MAG: hypothetical protein U5K74_07450 [Gemmatimonadaceae bacterium]|nr:hypothetical protein [Gemmatimonadaceae bacterium]